MKTSIYLTLLMGLLLTAAGCSKKTVPGQDDNRRSDQQHPIHISGTAANVFSDFSFEFFKKQQARSNSQDDIFVSPLSLHIALGMLANGAGGDTRTEIMHALKAENLSQEDLNEAYETLLEELPQADPLVQLSLANAIFHKKGFSVEAPFLNTLKTNFKAQISALDFVPADLEIINQWASDHTQGKIPQVLNQMEDNLVMLLLNAIYFKGDWRLQFDKANTRQQPFYRQAAGSSSVDMMQRKDSFGLATAAGYRALQLPYGNGQFTATLLLPDEGQTISAVFNQLDLSAWNQLQNSFQSQTVNLRLPKFQLRQDLKLNNTLQDMGIRSAFSSGADLSGISAGRRLAVSEVKQNSFAAVDEQGTEAAAVTTIGIVVTSVQPTIDFNCNKPFGLIISEKTSNTILFMGRIMDPKQ